MPPCRHHEICGLDALEGAGEGLCILHSQDPNKDKNLFDNALAEHGARTNDLSRVVFPEYMNFIDLTFTQGANFGHATFTQGANFGHAMFAEAAYFGDATFTQEASFSVATFAEEAYFFAATFKGNANLNRATFTQEAEFSCATFTQEAYFGDATFEGAVNFVDARFTGVAYFGDATFEGRVSFRSARFAEEAYFAAATFTQEADFNAARFKGKANFRGATFTQEADFSYATFTQEADFSDATFTGKTMFNHARFRGRTFFSSSQGDNGSSKSLPGFELDFRQVTIEPLDAISFRDVDLRRWRFLGTDLRKVEFANVTWPRKGGRFRVYDEDVKLEEGETRAYAHIERLYRQLKQNYEDQKDYERASDFHYGEKEMRRANKKGSPRGLRLLLTLYWLLSGYGERWVRPLMWAAVVFGVTTFNYWWWDFLQSRGSAPGPPEWWEFCLYSLQVMLLMKPSQLTVIGCGGRIIYILQSILGPLILGLFALAVRQRLKR